MADVLLTIKEVQKQTKLSYRSVLSLANRSDAPIVKVGKKRYFVASRFYEWIEKLGDEQAQIKA